tara:strand:+ start:1268 stop:2602 length:1335 start_codon:yes stop_codon:yes gene_type:complete
MTSYYSVNKIYNLNIKQKPFIIEFIWSVILVYGSIQSLYDIYNDNSLLDKGYNQLSDILLKIYLSGTITDFYLCYKEYNTYFTKITITHHIFWIILSFIVLYNNLSIYGAYVYLIEIPCIPKCVFKFSPRLKNTLLFARTWIVFRIFYFFNLILFLQSQFYIKSKFMYNTITLWWFALGMHIYWGYKLIKKSELENNLFKNRDDYTNLEKRPIYRGFIQHVLIKYYIIHCICGEYLYYTYSDNTWNNLYYLFITFSLISNIYLSYYVHCYDILKIKKDCIINNISLELLWNIDEFIITLMIFSKNIFIDSLIDKNNYNTFYYIFIKNTYYFIFALSTIFIFFIKKNTIYDFTNINTYTTYYKLYHVIIITQWIYFYIYSINIIEKTYTYLITWFIITFGGLIYYTKFIHDMKNKYINQHDIFHYSLYIAYFYSMIIDSYNEIMN